MGEIIFKTNLIKGAKGDAGAPNDLVANEYNSTVEYNVGNFCIHEDALYKCTATTTGLWDGTKWELTSASDETEANTSAIEAMIDVTGSCNILPNNAVTTTIHDVTFTVNEDKTIAVSGTPGQRLVYIPMFDHYLLKAGTYIVSSALPSSSYIFVSLARQSDSVEIAATTSTEDGSVEFTLNTDTEIKGSVGCYVPADKPPVSGVIKPMLYDVRLKPTGYVSPAMTNRGLTDALTWKYLMTISDNNAHSLGITFKELYAVGNFGSVSVLLLPNEAAARSGFYRTSDNNGDMYITYTNGELTVNSYFISGVNKVSSGIKIYYR